MRPAYQGSASIHIQGPNIEAVAAGKQCPAGIHYADAPSAFSSDQRTTGASRPKAIIDGEQSTMFQCGVVPSGDKFAVSAFIHVPAFDKDNQPLEVPTEILLNTTIGKSESGATGRLTVADVATGGASYQSNACMFSVKADAATQNSKLAIDSGKAWGSVTCPSIEDPKAPSTSCAVDVGYFILENCDQ